MAVKPCPSCGQNVSETAKKCVYCGAPTYACPKCGKTIDTTGAVFCIHCGHQLKQKTSNLTSDRIKVSVPTNQSSSSTSPKPFHTVQPPKDGPTEGELMAKKLYDEWRASTAAGKFYGGGWVALHIFLNILGVLFIFCGGLLFSQIISTVVTYRIIANLAGWLNKQDIDKEVLLKKMIDGNGMERLLKQDGIHDPLAMITEGLFLANNKEQFPLEKKAATKSIILGALDLLFWVGAIILFFVLLIFVFIPLFKNIEDFGFLLAFLLSIGANPCFYATLIISAIDKHSTDKRYNEKTSAKTEWLLDTAFPNRTTI